jgi:MSHA biogenesis protein MshP
MSHKPMCTSVRVRNGLLRGPVHAFGRCQRGFAVIAGVFLLVILSLLGAMMVTLFTTQQATAAQDTLGSEAYQAAAAGIQTGVYQVTVLASCPAITTLNTLSAAELAQFTVIVTCASTGYTENGAAVTIFQITSTATRGIIGSAGYVERRLTATLS